MGSNVFRDPADGARSEAERHVKELVEYQLRAQFVQGLQDPVRRFVLS